MRLLKHEMVQIMPWESWMNGIYNEPLINLQEPFEICNW